MGKEESGLGKLARRTKARGSVRNDDRLAAFSKRGPAEGGDWGGCAPEGIQAVVVGITRLGGAVTFGLSRDGGAHSVTLLLDDARATLWFNGSADLDEALQSVIDTLSQID